MTTDQILRKLVEKIHDGMDRFEARARGDRYLTYETIIEKHRAAVNSVMFGNGDTPGNRLRMGKEGESK